MFASEQEHRRPLDARYVWAVVPCRQVKARPQLGQNQYHHNQQCEHFTFFFVIDQPRLQWDVFRVLRGIFGTGGRATCAWKRYVYDLRLLYNTHPSLLLRTLRTWHRALSLNTDSSDSGGAYNRRQVSSEANGKRKAPVHSFTAKQKRKQRPTILEDGSESMVPPRHAKRSSSRGSMSISSDGQSLPASSNISDVEEMGGISSGSDVGERKEREGLREVKSGFHKVKLLAKVEPTTSVADYIPPSTAAQKVKNKQDIRAREDLPVHLKYAFDARFLPKLREALGVVRAWERPTDAQVRSIWEEVFPDEELGGWLETVVKKLVDGCISNWRTKMASTALESFKRIVVKTLVQQHPEATPKQLSEAIAGWCKWALQGDYKERPFYYLVYEEVEVEAKEGAEGFEEDVEPELVISAKGLFLHPLILATLAYHYSSISQIHQDARSDERPEGALVTAIQACQRAVSRWYSGDFLPLARPAGDFSKDNWGDNPTRVPTNFPQLPPVVLADPKSTSQLYRLVKRLSNSQWEKIIEGAIGAMRRQKAITVQALPDVVDAASSDFELHDDDDDV